MDLLKKTTSFLKPRKKLTKKHKATKTKSKSRSGSLKSLHSSDTPTTRIEKTNKNIRKGLRKLNLDKKSINVLNDKVNKLDENAKHTFTKKKGKKSSPDEPIMITVKNLNTGKQDEVMVVKNLNTGKYELAL
jgi:hypothetical protein